MIPEELTFSSFGRIEEYNEFKALRIMLKNERYDQHDRYDIYLTPEKKFIRNQQNSNEYTIVHVSDIDDGGIAFVYESWVLCFKQRKNVRFYVNLENKIKIMRLYNNQNEPSPYPQESQLRL